MLTCIKLFDSSGHVIHDYFKSTDIKSGVYERICSKRLLTGVTDELMFVRVSAAVEAVVALTFADVC